MPSERLSMRRQGPVLIVTLEWPERLNAYDGPALIALGEAWRELDGDPSLKVGVLTGSGNRAFCAGADLQTLSAGTFGSGPFPESAQNLARKPLIAAINGLCLGGGMMMAAGCDIRIADEHAEFGLPEVRWNQSVHWLGAMARQVLPATCSS